MKHLNLFICGILFICASSLKAQDIITKNDSSKVFVDLLELNPTQVKYKPYNYTNGPLTILNKAEIAYIVYRTGMVERFNSSRPAYVSPVLQKENVGMLSAAEKDRQCEKLYTYKNYIGFNYITFLNNCVGFNYARDITKANMIVSVPFAVGFASPVITNSLYSDNYLSNTSKFNYDKMNYQIGINAFFVPNMKREANFLIGPSFNYSSFDVKTELNYTMPNSAGGTELKVFENSFELRRKNYGITTGFLARFNERINMNMTVTLGYRIDTYSESDAFGAEYVRYVTGSKASSITSKETIFYANYLWSVGYRF